MHHHQPFRRRHRKHRRPIALRRGGDGAVRYVTESAKIGLRKPDPRIYRMMVEALGVDPRACVYLDDLGVNLKPARDMGMTIIKVVNAPQAIAELEATTRLSLRNR